jgi:hypothetical protein
MWAEDHWQHAYWTADDDRTGPVAPVSQPIDL